MRACEKQPRGCDEKCLPTFLPSLSLSISGQFIFISASTRGSHSNRPTSKRPCREKGTKIGQRSMLSKVDCMKLNQKFGCFKEGDTWHNEKIRWASWAQNIRERSPAYKLYISLHRFRVICGMMGFSFWTWWTYYFTATDSPGERGDIELNYCRGKSSTL